MVFHAGTFNGVNGRVGGVGPWARHLDVGVSVFFVLSAFLLYRPFVAARLREDAAPRTGPYLWRRVLRIVPAYWVALTVDAHVLHHTQLGNWWDQVRFYGFLQIYWGRTVLGGLAQAWSLCTEMSFYLFLPAWAALLRRCHGSVEQRIRLEYAGCGILYVIGLLFRWELRAGGHAIGYAWLPANFDLFALGMALAVAHTARRVRPAPAAEDMVDRAVGERPGVAWLAAACCYAGAAALPTPVGFGTPSPATEVLRQLLYGFVAVLVVAPGVFGPQGRGWGRRFLSSRALVAAGTVSYGVYLWHITLMIDLARGLGGPGRPPGWWALVATSLVAALAVAAVSWFLLERPILRLKEWGPGRRAVGAAGPTH